MKVLLTRRQSDNERMAHLFARHGLETVSLPMFELEDTGTGLPEGGYGFSVFTSAAAVEVLAARGEQRLTSLPAYAVGRNTAEALESNSYTDIRTGGGNAEMLAALISQDAGKGMPSHGLYPCGETRSVDLAAMLRTCGIELVNREVYRIRQIDPTRAKMEAVLGAVDGGAIAVFSAKGAERLLQAAGVHGLTDLFASIILAGISPNSVASVPANLFARTIVAERPESAALAEVISRSGMTEA